MGTKGCHGRVSVPGDSVIWDGELTTEKKHGWSYAVLHDIVCLPPANSHAIRYADEPSWYANRFLSGFDPVRYQSFHHDDAEDEALFSELLRFTGQWRWLREHSRCQPSNQRMQRGVVVTAAALG